MKKDLKSASAVLAALLTAVLIFGGCGEKSLAENLDNEIKEDAEYILETVRDPASGPAGGEWAVKGLKDSGIKVDEEYYAGFYDNIRAIVKFKKGILDKTQMTEYARIAIGLTAIGKDPSAVEGYDLIAPLDDYEAVVNQGVNAASFALVASNVSGFSLENEGRYIDFIVEALNSGKLGMPGEVFSVDYIAIATEGLSFYTDRADVKEAVDKAVETLEGAQKKDGSFGNCESTAEVICALSQLGIDVLADERFEINGKNPGDGLMKYKLEEGGFTHRAGGEYADPMSSEKGLIALNAIKLCKEGKPLYKGVL